MPGGGCCWLAGRSDRVPPERDRPSGKDRDDALPSYLTRWLVAVMGFAKMVWFGFPPVIFLSDTR